MLRGVFFTAHREKDQAELYYFTTSILNAVSFDCTVLMMWQKKKKEKKVLYCQIGGLDCGQKRYSII